MSAPLDNVLGAGREHVDPVDMERRGSVSGTDKTFAQRLFPAFAAGTGLFSDGYLNGVIGSVSTMLKRIYGKEYSGTAAQRNIGAITFAGTVFGQLLFGWTTDHWSRKWSIFTSTIIVAVFAILCTGAYGGGSVHGLTNAIVAYRFLLGIGIGGEYPAGSSACAESTGELKSGTRNRWVSHRTPYSTSWTLTEVVHPVHQHGH